MGIRSKGREVSLQYLYQYEIRKEENISDQLEFFFNNFEIKLDESSIRFAKEILRGIVKEQESIDEKIAKNTKNWNFNRISIVDKSILRIAVYEMEYSLDVPEKVAVNEAIELAKKYGSKDSGAFVNGILDKILKLKNLSE